MKYVDQKSLNELYSESSILNRLYETVKSRKQVLASIGKNDTRAVVKSKKKIAKSFAKEAQRFSVYSMNTYGNHITESAIRDAIDSFEKAQIKE